MRTLETLRIVIDELNSRGYKVAASKLSEVHNQYFCTTSEKIITLLQVIEWVIENEAIPLDLERELQQISLNLQQEIIRANNPWPWNLLIFLKRVLSKVLLSQVL